MNIKEKMKAGVMQWHYDFWHEKKRHRGWLLPVSVCTRRQAIANFNKIRAEIITNGIPDHKAEPTGLGLVTQIFKDHETYLKEKKPATYERINYMFDELEFFHKPQITNQLVNDYQSKRIKDGVSGATINRELELARTAFNRYFKNNRVVGAINPFIGIDKFDEVERTRYLNEEELKCVLIEAKKASDHKSPHLFKIVLTGIFTGMRRGEILKLHESEVNFNIGSVSKKATGRSKNLKVKTIPIPEQLTMIFLEGLNKERANADKFHRDYSGYVFGDPRTGKPYNNIQKGFKSVLKRAGVDDFRFHDLRHTFATYALLAAKDIRTIQELLGHSLITQTQRYTHILDGKKRLAVENVHTFISSLEDKDMDKSPNGKKNA